MIWVALLDPAAGPEQLRGMRWHFSVGRPTTDLIFAPIPRGAAPGEVRVWTEGGDVGDDARWVRVSDDQMRAHDERHPDFEPWPGEVVYRIDRASAHALGAEVVVTYRPLTPPPVVTERTEVVGAGGDVSGRPVPPLQCGRLLVGRGSDTMDPTCVLPANHAGPCRP